MTAAATPTPTVLLQAVESAKITASVSSKDVTRTSPVDSMVMPSAMLARALLECTFTAMVAATCTLPSRVCILGILLDRFDARAVVMVPFLPDRLLRLPAVLLRASAFFLLICSAWLSLFMEGVGVACSSLPPVVSRSVKS